MVGLEPRRPLQVRPPAAALPDVLQDLPKAVSSGIGKHILNNWAVTGLIVQSGPPLTVTNARADRGWAVAANSPPRPCSPTWNAGRTDQFRLHQGQPEQLHQQGCLEQGAGGTVGNSGRGMFRAPGQANLDFSLFKTNSPWAKSTRVEFRSEFYNIMNHANFGGPAPAWTPPVSGRSAPPRSTPGWCSSH